MLVRRRSGRRLMGRIPAVAMTRDQFAASLRMENALYFLALNIDLMQSGHDPDWIRMAQLVDNCRKDLGAEHRG